MAAWSKIDYDKAKRILRSYAPRDLAKATGEIAEALGRELTPNAVRKAFNRLGTPATSFCQARQAERESSLMQRAFLLTKREPLPFDELCDRLDLAPGRVRKVLDDAQAEGVPIHVEHGHVGVKPPTPSDRVVDVAPVVGKRQKVAVISDTHLGSKHCLRDYLKDFVHHAYERGVREVLHPGDVLDGMYRHGLMFEVSHMGIDEQARDLFETLPKLPGLNYRCITGNHDNTFTEASGVNVGRYLQNYFQRHGRRDLHFYGDRGAFLRVRGAVVHLWHPCGGVSYARSYKLQKTIEKYSSGEKPHVMLAGHWHVHATVYERGVHGIACPTFQGGGSAFSKSLGGAPAIGGLILSWGITKDGTMRDFTHEYRAYFEREQLVKLGFDEVEAA